MAKSRKRLVLQRRADPDEKLAKQSIKDTPKRIKRVKTVEPKKASRKNSSKTVKSEKVPTSKVDETKKNSAGAAKTTENKTVDLKPMKGHPHEPVQYTIMVKQEKLNHKGEQVDVHNAPLVVSGTTGSTVTLTPRYLTPPKGYQIKNPHQTWKIKLGASDYKVESKTQQIEFDYISERAGTLTIMYTNQNGAQVDVQHVSGYVDDLVSLNDLKLPSGYDLSTHIFQPITLQPHSFKIDLSVRGKIRHVVAPIKQELYSSAPKEVSTKVEVTGRVGDLEQIQPQRIDVPEGYKIRPDSKEMQLRITADQYQVPDDYPLVIHYVTTEPVYAVINFMDQNQRLVKNQVVKGAWGHYVDESALTLPPGYEFDSNVNPARLRMTKMIQVWRLQVRGVEKSGRANIEILYMNGSNVESRSRKTVTINSRVGNIYQIPCVEFYKPGYRPTTKMLEGIMTNSGLSKPTGEFELQRDTRIVHTKPHNIESSDLSQERPNEEAAPQSKKPAQHSNDDSADVEAARHKQAHLDKINNERQEAARKRQRKQAARSADNKQASHKAAARKAQPKSEDTSVNTDDDDSAAESIPSKSSAKHTAKESIPKPKPSKKPLTKAQLLRQILHTDWTYSKHDNVEVNYKHQF